MSDACCEESAQGTSALAARHRGVLWMVLAINFGLFVVEVVAGLRAGSSSLRVFREAWIVDRTPPAAAHHTSPGR